VNRLLDLVARLLMIVNSTDNHAPEYHIANTLLKAMRDIPQLRIETAAKQCLTSPATLSRFCTRLGYSNYTVFRKAVQSELEEVAAENKRRSDIWYYPISALAPSVLDSTVLMIRSLRQIMDIEQIKKGAEDLLSAEERIIMGPDAVQPVVLDFQMKMFLSGYNVSYQKYAASESEEDPVLSSESTLLIYLFPISQFLSGNINYVRQTGTVLKTKCKKLFITVTPELQVFAPDAACILLPNIPDQFNTHTNSILALQCALEMLYLTFHKMLQEPDEHQGK
jgi:RpiR family transcriptional regulator, carbohydrate utilization regulator